MAVTFTGSSYLSTTNVPAGQTLIASPFTVAIWVYPTTSGGTVIDGGDSGIYLAIVSSRTSGAQFLDSAAVMNSLSVGSWYLDLQQSSFGEEQYVEGANTHTNQWVHIAASYSGSGAATKVYQNGVLQTPLSSGGGLIASEAWNRIIVGGFNGDAQDAWIFNRVLTDSEVAQLYADRNAPINTSGLVAYYPLANGAGSVVDFSGNGRNLTATGTVVGASRNAPTSWRGRSPNIILPASSGLAITPAGTTNTTGAVTLTALKTITPAGTTNVTGAVTLTELAAIAPAGTTDTTGAVALGLTAPLATPAGSTQTTGSVALTALEAVAPAGTTNTTGSVALTALEALAPAGTTNTTGAVTLTALEALAPAGTTNVTGAVALGLTAPIAPAGSTQTTGAVALGSSEAITPSGTTQTTGAVALTELAALTPAGLTATTGSVTLGSSGGSSFPITPAGTTNTTGAVDIGELAAITPAGTTQTTGAVALTVLEALAPSGTTQTTGAVQLGLTAPLGAPAGSTQTTGAVQLGVGLQLPSAGSTNTTGAVALTELAALMPAGTTNVTGAFAMGKLIAFPSAGTTQCFGFVTLGGGTGPTATGGPFKGNVARRTMYAGRRRMRIM